MVRSPPRESFQVRSVVLAAGGAIPSGSFREPPMVEVMLFAVLEMPGGTTGGGGGGSTGVGGTVVGGVTGTGAGVVFVASREFDGAIGVAAGSSVAGNTPLPVAPPIVLQPTTIAVSNKPTVRPPSNAIMVDVM